MIGRSWRRGGRRVSVRLRVSWLVRWVFDRYGARGRVVLLVFFMG